MKIKEILWSDDEHHEADVIITNGKAELMAFAYFAEQSLEIGKELAKPLITFDATYEYQNTKNFGITKCQDAYYAYECVGIYHDGVLNVNGFDILLDTEDYIENKRVLRVRVARFDIQ